MQLIYSSWLAEIDKIHGFKCKRILIIFKFICIRHHWEVCENLIIIIIIIIIIIRELGNSNVANMSLAN